MTKTTYVFRNGELVEKPRPRPLEPPKFDRWFLFVQDELRADLMGSFYTDPLDQAGDLTPAHIDNLKRHILDEFAQPIRPRYTDAERFKPWPRIPQKP